MPPSVIPVAKPWMDEREAEAARRPILSGWVTQGPEVAAFEREFAEAVGARYACAVSSCTTALHLALLAAGVGPGDEVITASHSFIATANSIRYCGATPVFVDIAAGGFNIDPAQVSAAITERTRAILCVHQVGMPCDLAALTQIGEAHGLPVIEDAACAIGSEVHWQGEWQRIGRPHGAAACFSFHPRKVLTTGDGGMITTNDADWDARLRLLRQHGMSIPDTVRHGARTVQFEEYACEGYNYRMTDIQAAIGREQLKRLTELIERRRYLARRYCERLACVPGLGLPQEPEWARSNWQSFCARLPAACDQRDAMQRLLDEGISTRRGVMCAHREAPYRVPGACRVAGSLAESEAAQDRAIVLPLFHQLTDEELEYVCDRLAAACATAIRRAA